MSPGHRKAGRATTRSSRTETTSSSSVALLDSAARAEVAHHASRAVRAAGFAGAAAMPNQKLVRPSPEPVRQQRRQLLFHLARVLLAREPQPPRDPADVGVHGQRGRAESVVHHHPRSLPADSGQLAELLTLSREVSAVIARDPRHRLVQVLRFRPPEPDALDLLAEDLRRAAGVVRRGREPREERRRHLVHDRVGGLGGEHPRDQQLQLVFVVQRALRLGHLLFQPADDLREPARAVCFRFAGHRGRVYHARARRRGLRPRRAQRTARSTQWTSSICAAIPSPARPPGCARPSRPPKWATTCTARTPPSMRCKTASRRCWARKRPCGCPPGRWRTRSPSARSRAWAKRSSATGAAMSSITRAAPSRRSGARRAWSSTVLAGSSRRRR